MARRAVRNTYGLTTVGRGIEVRRRVIAGQMVPDSIVVDSADLEDAPLPGASYNPGQVHHRETRSAARSRSRAKAEKSAPETEVEGE